jgi:hypothetical protein
MIIEPYIDPKLNKLINSKVVLTCEYCHKNKRIAFKADLKDRKEYKCRKCSKKLLKSYKTISVNNEDFLEHRYIMEQHIGRKLTTQEQVHHIDFDKFNNNISNLFLCSSDAEHAKTGYSIEKTSYSLINKYIWFNRQTKIYTTSKIDNVTYEEPKIIFPETEKIIIRNNRKKTATYPTYSKNYYRLPYWRLVMECFLKREINKGEQIHHIDGDEYNNSINNLCLVTNKEHCNAQASLYKCAAELFKRNIIVFIDGHYATNKKIENKKRKERPCKKYELEINLPDDKNEICQDCGYKILYHKHIVQRKKSKTYKKHKQKTEQEKKRHIYCCTVCNWKTERASISVNRPCIKCSNKKFVKI